MINQGVQDLTDQINYWRRRCNVAEAKLEADAKRWETLCKRLEHTEVWSGWAIFGRELGCLDQMTPEALKSWLDKEAE